MTKKSKMVEKTDLTAEVSWLAMAIIVLAQVQMAFNVNALPVSIGPISLDLDTSATSVGTALVVYSLCVAAFVMLGAKIGKIVGERLAFQVSAVLHGAAMALMALARDASAMNTAQGLAGLAAAVLVPSLVVLIAANYHDKQQEKALGILAGSVAIAGALAFFVAGFLATVLTWRISFGILAVVSVVVLFLSFRLKPIPRQRGIVIDFVGALLAAVAIVLISIGFNNLNTWGLLLAGARAPFSLLGLSPAPIMIVTGIFVGQAFFRWSYRRQRHRKTPLLSLEVLDSREEQAATYAMLVIGALGPAVNFLIPLYMQIVQGRTSLQTAVAVVPYTLAIFAAAISVVRLYGRLSPRVIGATAFAAVAVGLAFLAMTIQNAWGTPLVILALVVVGLGEGALVTLVFNVLVSASPKKLAGDVGALRGTANNLSTALGTAIAGVLAVTLLSLLVNTAVANSSTLPPAVVAQVNLDEVDFISNEQLDDVLANTTASAEQVAEATRINIEARLRALKLSFLILAGVSLLAIFPATRLPNYVPREIDV